MPDESKRAPQPTAVFTDPLLAFGRYITVRNIETIEEEMKNKKGKGNDGA